MVRLLRKEAPPAKVLPPPVPVVDRRVSVPCARITLVAGEGKGARPLARVVFGLIGAEIRLLNFSGFVDAEDVGGRQIPAGWRGALRYPNANYKSLVLFETSVTIANVELVKSVFAELLRQRAGEVRFSRDRMSEAGPGPSPGLVRRAPPALW